MDHPAAGIGAVAICPGTVESEWITKILANLADPVAARRFMPEREIDGRVGSPNEVAARIASNRSGDGRFINGNALVMESGMTAQ